MKEEWRCLEDEFVQDARHAARLATRSPGLALAAGLSIAVGIGGSTAAFGLLDAALLRQWPYPDAGRLVVVRTDLGQYFSGPAFRRLEANDAVDWLMAADAHGFVAAVTRRFHPVQTAVVESVRERLFRSSAPTIRVLALVSLVILAVCCLNFATLLSVRTADRRQELAVRTALGAGRSRIVRQLVTEALVLSIAGGAAGVLVAQLARGAFAASGAGGISSMVPALDWRTLAFAALLTIATGTLFSIGPARRATATLDLDVALKDGAAGSGTPSRPRWFAANWLTGSIQVALTMVILVELSIRAALGARAGHLMWLAIRDGLVVAGIGGCLGILTSAAFTPQLALFLYQVSPWDPWTFGAVALVLIPVVVSAAYLPARRAARVDPLMALKSM